MSHPKAPVASAGPIGGASGDAGVEYRRAVAAYAVAHALTGEPLPGFGFALRLAEVVAVAVETDEHADDVRVTLSGGQKAQVQAKRSLRFDAGLPAGVAQWVAAAKAGLDPVDDRLVLVTGTASGPVQRLERALQRCKTDEPGAFTAGEKEVLERLDKMLDGLTAPQRELVRRCAVILVLDVEEEQSPGAAHARLLLGRVVGGGEAAVRAWRDLVAHCGRVGRLRGGFGVEGWVRLLQEDGHQVTGYATPAAEAARQVQAVDRYRDLLRLRGTTVDLRPLGADAAPIPLAEIDASVECVPAGAYRQDAEPLPWSLLRRRRVLLTGLPGGGKSVAMAAAAAVLADAAGAPLPLLVSLRDVDARDRSQGIADRVLDAAVRNLQAIDRPLVRRALERGLESGATALLLDSLDETHDRRGAVVAEVADLCAGASADVVVLLATRDSAYAQAATLGWDDLRLLEPQKPERAVRAVLAAIAAARRVENPDAWVNRRVDWVAAVLDRDSAARETPLMPVLLALRAADRGDAALPSTRAEILYGVVEAAVRRREAHRDPGLRVATLREHESADATLAAFAVEAGVLGDAGGQAPLAAVRDAVASALARDWGLPAGAAASGARTIVHFWDEIGILVFRGADETVSPRMELFLDIGDAVRASELPTDAQIGWVDARIRDGRHEPLILAAVLSQAVSERLVATACGSREHELLIAAAAAVRQHAPVSGELAERLVAALTADAASADQQGWTSYVTMLDLPGHDGATPRPSDVLAHYPHEFQVIAEAALVLRHPGDPSIDTPLLLDALHVSRLPRLPSRQPSTAPGPPWTAAEALHDEVLEKAARRLLGRVEKATELVVALLPEVSFRLHDRLLAALREAGRIDAAHDVLETLSRRWAGIAALATGYDPDGPMHLLDHLAQHSRAELTVAEAARLDELADLYQTLQMHWLGGNPRREEYASWLLFVDVAIMLGGFDPARLAAEAQIEQQRMERFGRDPFEALNVASQRRNLNRWQDIDVPAAVDSLINALFMGKATARIAAVTLSMAPPDVASRCSRPSFPTWTPAASISALRPTPWLDSRRMNR